MKGYELCSVLIFLSALSASLAAVGMGIATVHESHPGKCYNDKSSTYYSPGESWPMQGVCGKVTCEKMSTISSTKLMTSFVTCGKAMVAPPCYLAEEDLTKPYPDCCPQPICPESSSNDHEMPVFSSEENNRISSSNSNEASSENDIAMHFALTKNTKPMEGNGLEESHEEEANAASQKPRKVYDENQSFEIRMPVQEPPNFEYADIEEEPAVKKPRKVYDENQSFEVRYPVEIPPSFQFADIDSDHDARLNEVDAPEDFQWV